MTMLARVAGMFVLVAACGDAATDPDVVEPTVEVRVYFTRAGAPQPVTRTISPTFHPLPVALGELLEGPTASERANGYTSFFFEQTASALYRIEIRTDSLVVIDFLDFSHIVPDASTAAGAAMLLGEVNHTVFQFPFVKSIIYRFNGSCNRFFEWLNQTCRTIRRDAIAGPPRQAMPRVPPWGPSRHTFGYGIPRHHRRPNTHAVRRHRTRQAIFALQDEEIVSAIHVSSARKTRAS